jgi:uncharacterized protein (DUF2252 family)
MNEMKAKSPARRPMSHRELSTLLAKRRSLKMAQSPHAFVRGNTAQFYAWLAEDSVSICSGPPVWICGDCHIGNLGPIANSEGRVAIQIRDLDQTVVGNPAHDLIRMGLSLATVARNSVLPGMTTARMIETLAQGYLRGLASHAPVDTTVAPSIHIAFRQALRRKWRDLAKERIGERTRSIPRGDTFLTLDDRTYKQLKGLSKSPPLRTLIRALTHRGSDDAIKLEDAAYWVKGCSSLGLKRFAVLMSVGERDPEKQGLCLLDFKQACASVAPVAAGFKMPSDPAQRVVEGARALSPTLGERMEASRIGSSSIFVRELLPQDLKIEIEKLTEDEAASVAFLLASIVGQAHGRQMRRQDRVSWARTLRRATTKSLDAPSWLWTAIVHQLALHEEGYLAHCRRYLSR